jgi:hypothetical protein
MGRYSKNVSDIRNYLTNPEFRESYDIEMERKARRRRLFGYVVFLPFMAVMLYFLAKAQWHF